MTVSQMLESDRPAGAVDRIYAIGRRQNGPDPDNRGPGFRSDTGYCGIAARRGRKEDLIVVATAGNRLDEPL
ncbi:MAG: hypothetical protein KF769_15440, partial [Parvibaculum sp.]|nr:hypothetical protein [Parvibaculum sp.]